MSAIPIIPIIPIIDIPSSNKDFWLNVHSDRAYISWYNVMKDRRQKGEKGKVSKKDKKRKSKDINVVYDNKEWRQIFYNLVYDLPL
jgi:hypothetical protein